MYIKCTRAQALDAQQQLDEKGWAAFPCATGWRILCHADEMGFMSTIDQWPEHVVAVHCCYPYWARLAYPHLPIIGDWDAETTWEFDDRLGIVLGPKR